jgi:hypothetical protein
MRQEILYIKFHSPSSVSIVYPSEQSYLNSCSYWAVGEFSAWYLNFELNCGDFHLLSPTNKCTNYIIYYLKVV